MRIEGELALIFPLFTVFVLEYKFFGLFNKVLAKASTADCTLDKGAGNGTQLVIFENICIKALVDECCMGNDSWRISDIKWSAWFKLSTVISGNLQHKPIIQTNEWTNKSYTICKS